MFSKSSNKNNVFHLLFLLSKNNCKLNLANSKSTCSNSSEGNQPKEASFEVRVNDLSSISQFEFSGPKKDNCDVGRVLEEIKNKNSNEGIFLYLVDVTLTSIYNF